MAAAQILPDQRQPIAMAVGSASWTLTALLALYTYGQRSTPADQAVDRVLQLHTDSLRPLLQATVALASPVHVLVLCAVLSTVVLVARGMRAALLCTVGPVLALALARALQELLRRPSASLSGSPEAYPSGHMTATAALVCVGLVLTLGPVPARRAQRVAVRLALGLPLAGVGVALTALRDHYVTDVLGGVGLAVGAVLLTAVLLDATQRGAQRRWGVRTECRVGSSVEVSGGVPPAQSP